MNYQDIQIDFLCDIDQVSELSFSSGYGDHSVAYVKGIIDEKKRSEMLRGVNEETPFAIRKNDGKVLFAGFVSDIKFAKEDGLFTFQLTAKGATAKMDVLKRSRTFFKKGITYKQIIDGVVRTYPGASFVSSVNLDRATDFPIIQYKETDWEFIARLASMFGAVLRPVETSNTPKFEIGCIQKKVMADVTVHEDVMERDLENCEKDFYARSLNFSVEESSKSESQAVESNSFGESLQSVEYPNVLDYTTKMFTLKDYYPSGTFLRVNGAEMTVSYVEGYLDKGALCFDYVARLSDGIRTIYHDNEELAGASLTGTVKQRKGNTISLNLDIDQDDGIAGDGEDYFFAYAIETKGYYCMPVEGAKVHLYFPTAKEWEAIAVHSLRDGDSESTSDPSNRSLSNTTGAAIKMTPDGITMTSDKTPSVSVKLGADGSLEITATDITICGEDVSIGQGEDGTAANVSISAGEALFIAMMTGGEDGCVPKEDHFIAIQGVAQLYATNHIYHVTYGAPKIVLPTYDDSELRKQEQEQKEQNNDAVANKLIERNRQARAKFGRGLLMAALGTALIVVTGGAAAVAVGVALCAFAVADMAEAAQSHELAMKGDWSTPATNLLKEVIPDPYYSLIENGLIIAGSIMFAGPAMAGKMLIGAGINTAVDLAFDLIPDGKLDKSFMEYLDSFSTNLMVSALTGPIAKGMDGCSGPWANFGKQFVSGFAGSTLGGIAQGELSFQGLAENALRELVSAGISTKIGFTMEGKNKWLVAAVDTLSDTAFDSASQLVDIALGRQESFDWERCAKTAVTSAANNLITACDPVNAARGNLLVYKEELVFAGLYGLEKWFRRYDSALDHESAFGKGWIHAYESFVFAEPIGGSLEPNGQERLPRDIEKYRIIAMLPDTHKEKFVWKDGRFVPEREGAPYRFTLNPDDTFTLEEWIEEKYKAYYYDRYGRLVALKAGRNHLPTKIFYVEQGDAVPKGQNSTIDHVEYPGGQRLDFTYQDGKITSVTDHVGRTIVYHYQNGRLDYVNYPTGGHQEYFYDKNGHITQLKGEDGRDFMTNAYDSKGRVVCQSYPDGSECRIEYVDTERKTIFRYSDSGRIEINYYNDKEEVVRREYGDDIFETMEYDDYGNKIAETDKNGNTTRYRYDQNGHLIEKALPEGLVISYVYDEAGRLIKESDNTGACTVSEYDKEGNLISTRVKIDEHSVQKTTYERDQYGRMTSMTDALGNTTKYFYEEDIDKPTEINTAEGYVIRYRYDKAGRRTGIITDYGEKEIAYSETGQIGRETDALGNTTRYLRDSVGNLVKLIRPNDYDEHADNGEGTYFEYDYLDRLIATKYPDGSVKKSKVNMDGTVLAENLSPVLAEEAEEKATVYQYDGRQYRTSMAAPDGGVTFFVRDKNGNLLKQIRPEEYAKDGKGGAGLSYRYDKEGRLVAILDEKDRIYRSYRYDLKGRLIEVKLGDAEYGTKYVYGVAGQLLEKWMPVRKDENGCVLWNVTLYEYDIVGNRILERRSGDEVKEGEYPKHYLDIRMSYDKQNRLIKIEDSLGAVAEYTYDCLNKRLSEKSRINEEKSRLICYQYDAAGRLVEKMESVDLPDMGEEFRAYRKKEFLRTKFKLDKNGNVVKTTLPNGGTITRTYDGMDKLLTETLSDKASGLNRTAKYTYNIAGNIISACVVGTDGKEVQTTTYRYDKCDRMIAETNAEGGTTRYVLNKNGEVVKLVTPDQYDEKLDGGDGYRFAFDAFGRLVNVIDSYGNLVEESNYDAAGQLLSKRDVVGLLYRAEYDLGGRRTSFFTNDEAKPVQTFEYDSLGNVIGVTDGEENYTSFTMDAWGRITELKKPDGSVERYTYDTAGNVISSEDGNGNTIRYTFNSLGRVEKITDQAGNVEEFSYDHEGNRTRHKDRNGKTIISKYGSFRYLLSERGEDGSFRTRKYNSLGQLTESATKYVTYRYDYDDLGRLKTKYSGGRAVLTYTYTKSGKLATITDVSGKTTKYGYDKNGKLIRVSEVGDIVSVPETNHEKVIVDYAYDNTGRLSDIRFANGIHTSYEYDRERNLAALKAVGVDGKILMSYSYQYDRNGNRTEKADDKGNATQYVYDSLQRLSEVSYPETGREKFSFDHAGNRISKSTDSYVEQYSYDERNRMTQSEKRRGDETPEVTRFSYDAQGSLLSEEGASICKKYLYNDFHQCITTEVIKNCEQVADNAAKQVERQENEYDEIGLRFALIENGKRTEFVTNGWDNLAELDENGVAKKRIIRCMGIAAGDENGEYYYYHGNERSDVELITDENGNVANRYAYDAFGTITSSDEKIDNRYTYNGEAYDRISGQYYLRKRFYNPALSRFTQEDEYRGDGLNLYAFCAHNPVMYLDPSGYDGVPTTLFPENGPNNSPSHQNSTGLGKSIQNELSNNGQIDLSDVNFGTHQGQHIIPQEVYKNNPMLKEIGFDLGGAGNGIYDYNNAKTLRNQLADKGVSQDLIDMYVSDTTRHGGYHKPYSDEVQKQVSQIQARFDDEVNSLVVNKNMKYEDAVKEVKTTYQKEVAELVDNLRTMQQEGLDLYKSKKSNISGNEYADQDAYHEYFEDQMEQAKAKKKEQEQENTKCGSGH